MIVQFSNDYLEDLYVGNPVKGKPKYSTQVVKKFIQKIAILKNVENSTALYQFRGLNFEALQGDKKGKYSIRVDKKYRIEFRLEQETVTLLEIALIDDLSNHYE